MKNKIIKTSMLALMTLTVIGATNYKTESLLSAPVDMQGITLDSIINKDNTNTPSKEDIQNALSNNEKLNSTLENVSNYSQEELDKMANATAPTASISKYDIDKSKLTSISATINIVYDGTDANGFMVKYKTKADEKYTEKFFTGSQTESNGVKQINCTATLTGLEPDTEYTYSVAPFNLKYDSAATENSDKIQKLYASATEEKSFSTLSLDKPTGKTVITSQAAAVFNGFSIKYDYQNDGLQDYDNIKVEARLKDSSSTISTAWNECTVSYKNGLAVVSGKDKFTINSGSTYLVRITPYRIIPSTSVEEKDGSAKTVNKDYTAYGTSSNEFEVVTSPYLATDSIKASSSDTSSLNLTWNPVEGATGYKIEYKLSAADSYTVVNSHSTTTAYTLQNLTADSKYTVRIFALLKSSTGFTAEAVLSKEVTDLCLMPTKADKPTALYYYQSKANHCATFEVTPKDCSSKYEYQVKTAYLKSAKSLKKVTKTNARGTNVATISCTEFTGHKVFKIRVRAISLSSDGVSQYGEWSDYTYFSPQPDIQATSIKSLSKGISFKWDTISGAKRYAVYVSTQKKSGYKLYKTTGKTSITVTKCGSKKLKKGTTYYFYVVPQVKVNGQYVDTTAANAVKRWSKKK